MPANPTPQAPLERRIPKGQTRPDADALLEAFLSYVEEQGLSLYPAQEEAVLEIFAGHSVVLNTPTGSGKSLVALAACFRALAEHKFAFYTAPIKALVTEKFFELCRVLGPQHVGMMTGDAAVNRDAPVICCTAEILASIALREGAGAQADWVVMDEFHYYSDRDRGGAWQIPLLTLPHSRFLLMSATLGDTDFFVRELESRTGAPATLVKSSERPVPLDFEYSEKPLHETVLDLNTAGRTPIYIVHFAQRAASERAQDLMSLNFLSKEEKAQIKQELAGFRFDTPFGSELRRFVPHGVGVHHAGMLPKYRRLTERLAQKGLLRVICGTDTLGVGVNVPIRTVLFTQLCKFDGERVGTLPVRDFLQIAGRAGRRGFDTRGTVVVQAPEHEIENKLMKQRAIDNPKKLKKLRLKKPPEKGYTPWNEGTLDVLKSSPPEPLRSSLSINHGMLLTALSGTDGCSGARRVLRRCHERPARKRALLKEGFALFRSLVEAEVVKVEGGRVRVSEALQENFSMNQALSLYALEALEALDREQVGYELIVLSLIEAIVETPSGIIKRQIATLKTQRMAELKAAGVEYAERIEELEKVEHPKPESEMIYETFNLFAKHHPWVAGYNISPKAIVRDMYEQAASFNQYVKDYGLARLEGVLLRYMVDVYRTLRQTVPQAAKTQALAEIEEWIGLELRRVDASLIEEWERLEGAPEQRATTETVDSRAEDDITSDLKKFSILVRNMSFRFVQSLARRSYERAIEDLRAAAPAGDQYPKDGEGEVWSAERLGQALRPYFEEYDAILTDADARSVGRAQVTQGPERLQLAQTLTDPEAHLEWHLDFGVDLRASREENRVVASLLRVSGA